MAPEISVIIPAYNAAEFLRATVESVLLQSFTAFELIIANDGSTDDTLQVANSISDPRIKVHSHANIGQSATINRGVELSRGRFIKLLDADDWLNPQHLELQRQCLAGDDVIASAQWFYFHRSPSDATPRPEATDRDYSSGMEWFEDAFRKDEGMVGGWRWMVPRQLWDRTGGYDSRLTILNDVEFATRLLQQGSAVKFSKGAVYGYRCGHSSSMSNDFGRRTLESAIEACRLSVSNLQQNGHENFVPLFADRLQEWKFRCFPYHPDLTAKAQSLIDDWGGSKVQIRGGRFLRLLEPWVGWKGVRRLQCLASQFGWRRIQALKQIRRLREFN